MRLGAIYRNLDFAREIRLLPNLFIVFSLTKLLLVTLTPQKTFMNFGNSGCQKWVGFRFKWDYCQKNGYSEIG